VRCPVQFSGLQFDSHLHCLRRYHALFQRPEEHVVCSSITIRYTGLGFGDIRTRPCKISKANCTHLWTRGIMCDSTRADIDGAATGVHANMQCV
jgi:hypothetical protein